MSSKFNLMEKLIHRLPYFLFFSWTGKVSHELGNSCSGNDRWDLVIFSTLSSWNTAHQLPQKE
jgi:hypothetical protein